ncbi:MAG: hypothetical protein EXR55_05245 [Dehalococcoidia bacterium]|nr:hypothetical protein [Dehalococcoidia bacterium]
MFELVDNAFDQFDGHLGGDHLEVRLEATKDKVVVEDTGGRGMGIQELRQWLHWGEIDARADGGGIREYGQGGKASTGYIGKAWSVQSK